MELISYINTHNDILNQFYISIFYQYELIEHETMEYTYLLDCCSQRYCAISLHVTTLAINGLKISLNTHSHTILIQIFLNNKICSLIVFLIVKLNKTLKILFVFL